MSIRVVPQGATSVTEYLYIRDSTTGAGKTGLVYNSSGAGASYMRPVGTRQAITLATLAAADSAWSSGGFKEVDATNMPGLYRFDPPNAAFAAGAGRVILQLVFTGAFVEPLDVALTPLPDLIVGAVVTNGSNSATSFDTDLTGSNAASYDNMYLVFRTGSNAGMVRKVAASGFNTGTGFLTVTAAFPSTPANTDAFVLINQ